jgi:hypothetical protein
MALMLKTKSKTSAEIILQLSITLITMYVANKITVDIWRLMTGH